MPSKKAPEFYYDEKRKLYRKRVKDSSGKWVDVWGKTKSILRTKVANREADIAEAEYRKNNPLVVDYAATWYSLYTPGKTKKTKQNYAAAINHYICPTIGLIQLADVKPDDAKAVMVSAADRAKETQKRILSVMRMIFKAAVKSGYMKTNPAEDLRPGGAPTAEKIPLTREQQDTLMQALEGHRCKTFCAIALYAGLRREEVLGLEWEAVHLAANPPYLEVKRACRWEGNAGAVNETLKSKSSRRKIPLSPQLQEILNEESSHRNGLFVCHTEQGKQLSCSAFRRMWNAIEMRSERLYKYKCNGKEYERWLKIGDRAPYTGTVVSIDFGVQPHQLRHTFITELILAGANIKTVQYLAGHSDIKITLEIYTHLMANRPQDTMDDVLKAFGGTSVGVLN